MNETQLTNAIQSLPKEIEPDRELWSGISARLGDESARYQQLPVKSAWRTPALAASVLLALATGIFIGRGMDPVPAGGLTPGSVLEFALISTVEATEREYQAAFQELVPLDYSGMRLANEESDVLRGSWEDLQHAETSLLAALREYPADLYLNEKLMDLRSQQLQFVKRLALLEQNNWRRT